MVYGWFAAAWENTIADSTDFRQMFSQQLELCLTSHRIDSNYIDSCL